MRHGFPQSRTLFLVAVAVWLAGCASTPQSRFYTLNSLAPQETKQPSRDTANPVSVGIAPVEIPDYLERPQIVTRDGRNELRLAEFDRWAGSLSDNISAVLSENLSMLLGSDRVFVNPGVRSEKPDYAVAMRVLQLDCVPGEHVLLKAQWTLFAGPDRKNVTTRVTTFTERLSDPQYDTMVGGVSRTLEQVSREIAGEIIARPKQTSIPPVQGGP